MWDLHDRLEPCITEATCRDEIESIRKHGQRSPVLGRQLHGDPAFDIELIYGARRLFVARHLNKPITVELRDLSDKEAIIAMDIENRLRQDISPYERGRSYARWLRASYFGSQEEIARALKISHSQISRLLQVARLPSVVVNAFAAPSEICERWGLDLMRAWEDSAKRTAIGQRARAIGAISPRPPAREVYRQLLSAAVRGGRVRFRPRDEVVTSETGTPLFRIRHQRTSIALLIPVDTLSRTMLDHVREILKDYLHRARVQPPDISDTKQPTSLTDDAMRANAAVQWRTDRSYVSNEHRIAVDVNGRERNGGSAGGIAE